MATQGPLFNWGPVQFEIYPLSVNEVQHLTGTDWARKEIAGAPMYREWVGEGDEEIQLRGKIYPHFIVQNMRSRITTGAAQQAVTGGVRELDTMDNMRRLGQAHVLMRGDGWHFGWFVIESLSRAHSFLAQDGIGQQIVFDVKFVRVPVPNDASNYFPSIWGQLR